MTSAALLLEAEQLTFGDQAQRLRPAQPVTVLAGRLRSHRAAVTASLSMRTGVFRTVYPGTYECRGDIQGVRIPGQMHWVVSCYPSHGDST